MLKAAAKSLRGGGALLLAIVLALSLIPVTQAYAASYPEESLQVGDRINEGDIITGTSSKVHVAYDDKEDNSTGREDVGPFPYTVTSRESILGYRISDWVVMESKVRSGERYFLLKEYVVPEYDIAIDSSGLSNATVSASPQSKVKEGRNITLTITPAVDYAFTTPPTVSSTGITAGTVNYNQQNNRYVCELTNATGPVSITVAGTANEAKYTAQVDKTGLAAGANAWLDKTQNIRPSETVPLFIEPGTGKMFTAAPTVTTNGKAIAGVPQENPLTGVYTCNISGFTGDVVVTVTGTTVDVYTATLNTDGLSGATAALSKNTRIKPTDTVLLTVSPEAGKVFASAPLVTAPGATVGMGQVTPAGAWQFNLSNFTANATVTVVGVAEPSTYTATLNTTNLKNAEASLSKTTDIAPTDTVTLTITPDGHNVFATAPTVVADGATAGLVVKTEGSSSYTCQLSSFTKNATIAVSGEAGPTNFNARLDTSGLKGATATISQTSGIGWDHYVNVVITPNEGKTKVVTAPAAVATPATGYRTEMAPNLNGTYSCVFQHFTADTVITVTGEFAAPDPVKPDIKVSGNGTHLVGAGGTLTFTCSLPLEELTGVLVDGKTVDESNFEKKSGSTIVTLKAAYLDTLAEGKHTIKLAYTKDRAASLDFTVTKAKPLPTDDKGGSKIAKTGDPLDAAPLVGAAGVAAALVGAAALRRRRDAE